MKIVEIEMSKKDFLKYSNEIIASSVMIEKNKVTFKTDEETLNMLEGLKIKYKVLLTSKKRFHNYFKLYFGLIFSLITFIAIFYIHSFRLN